ncbi:hypothetical protein D6T64_13070 [Cryobacterium melibiosiphilum]|uniref:Uncharacterized protein n=1 Tax=Cryobacterium melibiosiphilum TaxID=995039 RepID=A0A3A5MNZ5_9MICO|nr:hypothetical protein [Cryobacterium melibiosiphilum]RJT87786.1 hypothetical protein D6T64_13070 [Cryobacterium melibiosiphilum]
MSILERMKTMQIAGPAAYLVLGLLAATVGLLPWMVTGMVLPIQNLWAIDVAADEMPITLLPFSQYTITLIVAVLVTGSAIAGGVLRLTRAQHPRFAFAATLVGVLIVQVVAIVQTVVTVAGGLAEGREETIYLAGLTAGTIAANLVGLVLLVLITRAPAAGALVAVSVAAVAAGVWVNGLISHPFGISATEVTMALLSVTRYVPAVIVGLAVAWCGFATAGRIVAAVVSFLALWIGPALFTGVSAAVGTRVLAAYPAEMLDYGVQVFVSALGPQGTSLVFTVAAAVVTAIALVPLRTLRSRREHVAA